MMVLRKDIETSNDLSVLSPNEVAVICTQSQVYPCKGGEIYDTESVAVS